MKNNFSDCHFVRFSVHVLMLLTVKFRTFIQTFRHAESIFRLTATSEPYQITRCSALSPGWC